MRLLGCLLRHIEPRVEPRRCCLLFPKHLATPFRHDREAFLTGGVDSEESKPLAGSSSRWTHCKRAQKDLLVKLESNPLIVPATCFF